MTERAFTTVLVGEGTLLTMCGLELMKRGHTILLVISPDHRVRRWAEEHSIGSAATFGETQVECDILFSITNYAILPKNVLDSARWLSINYHDSLLPTYAGLHSTTWALLNLEKRHGVTWHAMDDAIDTGDILVQQEVTINLDDTATSLNVKCFIAAVTSFRAVLDGIESRALPRIAQDISKRTYFGKSKRPPAGCAIDFDSRADAVSAFVRGLTFGRYPNPIGTPKVLVGGRWYSVGACRVLDSSSLAPPGEVVRATSDSLVVATGTSDVELSGLRAHCAGQLMAFDGESARLKGLQGQSIQLSANLREEINVETRRSIQHERFWSDVLLAFAPIGIYHDHVLNETCAARVVTEYFDLSMSRIAGLEVSHTTLVIGSFIAVLAAGCGWKSFGVRIGHDVALDTNPHIADLFETRLPLTIPASITMSFLELAKYVESRIDDYEKRGAYVSDLEWRMARRSMALSDVRPGRLDEVAILYTRPGENRGDALLRSAGWALEIRGGEGGGKVEVTCLALCASVWSKWVAGARRILESSEGNASQPLRELIEDSDENRLPASFAPEIGD